MIINFEYLNYILKKLFFKITFMMNAAPQGGERQSAQTGGESRAAVFCLMVYFATIVGLFRLKLEVS